MIREIDLAEATRMLESITTELAARRADVAKAVSAPVTAERLAELVNQIAEAEGSFHAIETVRRALDYNARMGGTATSSWAEGLVARLAAGADDRWSGRTNDAKRAWFDGFRGQAARFLDV